MLSRFITKFRALPLLAAVLLLQACGYTFQGTGTVLPPDVRRIYIPMVENNSTEPGLSTQFTEALRDYFDRYGAVTVVDNIADSDAVLRAKILRVRRDTASVTSSTDTAVQFDATLNIAAELRRVNSVLLWRDNNIVVSRAYGAQSGVVVTSSPDFLSGSIGAGDLAALGASGEREVARGQEAEAFTRLTEKAAKLIYDSAVAPDF